MKLVLLFVVIWAVWAFLARRKKKRTHGRDQSHRNGDRPLSPTNAAIRPRGLGSEPREPTLAARRQQVLLTLRAGKLGQGQIVHVLENASLYGFSADELLELRKARKSVIVKQGGGSPSRCIVCGMQAVPGEDLCYSHLPK